MWKSLIQMAKSQPLFDWRYRCTKINFELFHRRFLDPREGDAWYLTCPRSRQCEISDCGVREVRTIGGHLVAYCRHNPQEERIPLREADVTNWGLNYRRFHKEICQVLHLDYVCADLDHELFWELGAVHRGVGKRTPVYISYYLDRQSLREQLTLLLAEGKKPFLVCVADKNLFPREMISTLDSCGCGVIFLNEAIKINEDTSFSAAPETLEFLSRFAGTKTIVQLEVFNTPPGTTWKDVFIRHKDSESVSVWLRGTASTCISFARLGMENSTKHTPSLAFVKLLEFLEAPNGRLLLSSKGTKDNNDLRKRVCEIRRAFKRFFPDMQGEPISLLKTEGSYFINFTGLSMSDE